VGALDRMQAGDLTAVEAAIGTVQNKQDLSGVAPTCSSSLNSIVGMSPI
jgi:hypothetical protein